MNDLTYSLLFKIKPRTINRLCFMLRNTVIALETSFSIWLHLSGNRKVHDMQYLQSIMQNAFYPTLLPSIIFDFNLVGIKTVSNLFSSF